MFSKNTFCLELKNGLEEKNAFSYKTGPQYENENEIQ
jgi:hypothetical protein